MSVSRLRRLTATTTVGRQTRRSSGIGTPVVADSSRQALSTRARQGTRTPAPRWHRRTSPACRRLSTLAGARRSRSIRSNVKLRAPPPATIELAVSLGSTGRCRAMLASTVNAVERCGTIRSEGDGRQASARQNHSDRAISAAAAQRTDASSRVNTQATSTVPWAAVRPSRVERLTRGPEHMVVEQRIARTGIAGDQDIRRRCR